MKLKFSVTKLESFRKHAAGELYGVVTRERVIEAVTGTTQWNPEMNLGGAYHLIIEKGEELWDDGRERFVVNHPDLVEPMEFTARQAGAAFDYRYRYPGVVHECPANNYLSIDGYQCRISMRIDGIFGLELHECKTTSHLPAYSLYERSYQWRNYLLASGAPLIRYPLFYIRNPRGQGIEVEYTEFSFYPYRGMEQDVKNGIRQFIRFCERQKLMDYLLDHHET